MFKKLFGKKNPSDDPTSILNVLLSRGWITQPQAEHVLREKEDSFVGEKLIELGYLSRDKLEEALIQQRMARNQMRPAEAASILLERQSRKQDTIIAAMEDLKDTIKDASTGKFTPITRKV